MTGDRLIALNPDDGTVLWTFPFLTALGINCTTPVQIGDKLLVSATNFGDRGGGTALLQLAPKGPKQIWANRILGAGHNDPVVIDGRIYAFSGYSINDRELQCLDLLTGERKWASGDVGGPGTVLAVEGRLMCLGNRGMLALAKPSDKGFEKITSFQAVKGKPVWTVPVIAGDRLYIRFVNQLICYAIK